MQLTKKVIFLNTFFEDIFKTIKYLTSEQHSADCTCKTCLFSNAFRLTLDASIYAVLAAFSRNTDYKSVTGAGKAVKYLGKAEIVFGVHVGDIGSS